MAKTSATQNDGPPDGSPEGSPAGASSTAARSGNRWLAPVVVLVTAVAAAGVAVLFVKAYVEDQRNTALPGVSEPLNSKLMTEPLPAIDFALTDQDGRAVTDEDLHGTVYVADFMLTRCTGVCPQLLTRMREVQSWLANDPELSEVRLISFSVDGEHDTPEVLRAHGERHGADPSVWRFLTGPREAVWQLSQDQLGLYVADALDPVAAQTPVVHSGSLLLIDRLGRTRGFYSGTTGDDMGLLKQDLFTVLGEGS
ncbi:MAG: SCO family protein [Planctomycetota bacterium]